MTKINRFDGNLEAFASKGKAGERYVFGSPTQSSDELTAQFTPEALRGWGTVGASEFPPLEWFNAVAYTATQLSAYLHQIGMPEWNNKQEYHRYSFVNYSGKIYRSKTNSNVGKQPASSSDWSSIEDSSWCEFLDYPMHARVIGSNGIEYRATNASGPNNGGALDPISDATKWQEVRPQLAVGETLFLAVDQTPNQLGYIGTWAEQESGTSLRSTSSGSPDIGTISGSNTQSVPLLQHTHTATSSFTGNPLPDHTHPGTYYQNPNFKQADGGGPGNVPFGGSSGTIAPSSSGTPSGVVNTTIDSEGVPSPSIDVSGKGLIGVLWVRTA